MERHHEHPNNQQNILYFGIDLHNFGGQKSRFSTLLCLFRRLLAHEFPISPAAIEQTMAIVPLFNTKSGWRIHGKTGSGWTRNKKGQIHRNRPEGWFVGWAERDGRVIVFARLGVGSVEGRQGLVEQKKLLTVLEKL